MRHEWRKLPMKMSDTEYTIGSQKGIIRGEDVYCCGGCGLVCLSGGYSFPGGKCVVESRKETK